MNRQDYEHMIGQTYQLKPSIIYRPDYFNDQGRMDKYLDGQTFVARDVVRAAVGWCIEIADDDDRYNYWVISFEDIIPVSLDNRKVRTHG